MKREFPILIGLLVLLITASCRPADESPDLSDGHRIARMTVVSPAWHSGQSIPVKYSCDGENISPEIRWTDIPAGTRSLVLIMDDPDAPAGTWVHWVLFNIPADRSGLPENMTSLMVPGSVFGTNSWKKTGYGGPCPPGGTHRYFFRVYALDKTLDLDGSAGKAEVITAMKSHVIGMGELMGKYTRRKTRK